MGGNTPDISEWADFTFFDRVWYHVPGNTLSTANRRLGRWLGISHRVGSDLCYWILTEAGHVIASTTVQHVTSEDAAQPATQTLLATFDRMITTRLDDTQFTHDPLPGLTPYIQDEYPAIDPDPSLVPPITEYGDMAVEDLPEADDVPDLDNYIHANLLLDVGGEKLIEFTDGSVAEYTANVIAENIYSQIDAEGRSFAILQEISGHRKQPGVAIEIVDGFVTSANGNKVPKRTTKGWDLQVEWKGGEQEWIPLKDLKNSNPIEVAEYAKANNLEKEPAFSWWIHEVLRQRRRMVSKVKSKYWRTTHKFGIKLPHSAEEALLFDKESGTDFWARAMEKELRKVKVAYETRDDLNIEDVRRGRALIGYTEIKCHMIFDVKMDFTRKARFVAGGHRSHTQVSCRGNQSGSRS